MDPSFCPSLQSLPGLWVVRLSGHYTDHLFARCYCLHAGDFIRCCDNFINLVVVMVCGVSLFFFFFSENIKLERLSGVRYQQPGCISNTEAEYITRGNYWAQQTWQNPSTPVLMRYARLMLSTVPGCSLMKKHKDGTVSCSRQEPWSVRNRADFPIATQWIYVFSNWEMYQTNPILGTFCALRTLVWLMELH